MLFSCHLGCGREQVEDDTGLLLEFFFPANKNKSVPASMVQEKGEGKASSRNKVFLYFDCLMLLTREISWCTIAFSLCWDASARHMLLSKMQLVQTASVEGVLLLGCFEACI